MAKPTRPTAFLLRRTLWEAKSKSIRQYATRTGEVIWAWNFLHERLQMVFVWLALPDDLEAGLAIWHSIRSDSSQRNLLRAALENMAPKSASWFQGAMWLMDAIEKLAPHRNDATHVPTILNWTERAYVTASFFAKPAQAKRLTSSPGLYRFHRLLRDDLYVLSNYATAIRLEMREPGKYGRFPGPPELQSIRLPRDFPKAIMPKKKAAERGKASPAAKAPPTGDRGWLSRPP